MAKNFYKVERREVPRYPIKLEQSFSARMEYLGETHFCLLHILDLSEKGMRVSTGYDLPLHAEIRMQLQLEEPVNALARVVWKKPAPGEGWLIGIHFQEISLEEKQKLNHFILKNSPERRGLKRHAIILDKIFSAQVAIGGKPQFLYLYVIDITEGGMRITADILFPEKELIPLTIFLDDPLETQVELVWHRMLEGGTYVMGLKFVELSEEQKAAVNKFIEHYSLEGKRKAFRLNRQLSVEFKLETSVQKFYTLALDFSPQGMRIVNSFPLPEELEIPMRIVLDFHQPPLEVIAKVAWQKEAQLGYMAGLEFTAVSEADKVRINQFIDRAIQGESQPQFIPEISEEE